MIGFGIVTGLLCLLMAAVLELNKNTLLGFVLLAAVTVAFWVLDRAVFELELRFQRDMTVISPFGLMDLSHMPLTLARGVYIVLFFLVQVCVLWLLSNLRLRRTDLAKLE